MQKFRVLFCVVLLILCCFAGSFSQTAKTEGNSLAPDASLADIQKWLKNSLEKYGKFKEGSTTGWLSQINFDGCVLNYRIKTTTDFTRPVTSAGQSPMPALPQYSTLIISFDLKDMDPAGTTLKKSKYKGSYAVYLYTLGGEKTVKQTWGPSKTTENFVAITLDQKAANDVRAGFMRAIRLCRTVN